MGALIQKLIRDGNMDLWHSYRSGSFRDWSGNDYDGTPTGVYWSNNGLGFSGDAANSNVDMGDVLDKASGSITLFALVTHHNLTDFQAYIAKGNSVTDQNYFFRNDDGVLEFYFTNTGGTINRQMNTAAAVLTAGEIQGVAVGHTWGSTSDSLLYLNGIHQAGDNPGTDLPLTTNNSLTTGCRQAGAQTLNGILHEAMIIGRILTATEHSQLYGELMQ